MAIEMVAEASKTLSKKGRSLFIISKMASKRRQNTGTKQQYLAYGHAVRCRFDVDR